MANKIEVVVATLNVSFADEEGDNQGAGIKLEIDDREDGLNGGDTSFKPLDDAYFFMYVDESKIDLVTTTPKTSAGGVSPASPSSAIVDKDEYVTFSNSNEGALGYYPYGGVTMTWIGRAYELVKTTVGEVVTYTLKPYDTIPDRVGSKLSTVGGKKVIGILGTEYQAQGSLWKLSGVPADIPEALITAIGTTKP